MADTPSSVQDMLATVKKYGFEYFGLYYGNYRGVIVNNQDPQKLGRVQIRIPQIAGDNKHEYWAWPKGQPAGEDFGDFMIPPKGSPVWVEFENGDPQHPIWSGGHWGKSAAGVPSQGKLASPTNRVRKSEKWIIEMDDATDVLRISSKSGGHKIEIKGNGDIAVSGGGNLTQTTGGNETKNITGDKSVSAKNLSMNITDDSTFDLGGVAISITGGVLTFSIGGASLSISAAGVTIMGRDFLTHHHNGVVVGGGESGGVV